MFNSQVCISKQPFHTGAAHKAQFTPLNPLQSLFFKTESLLQELSEK
jgi:hypothetical protein